MKQDSPAPTGPFLYEPLKRSFDLGLSLLASLVLAPCLAVLAVIVKLTSKGPVLYWSDRVGKDGEIFSMPKFRTMRTDTPVVATHLLDNPDTYLTPVGGLLRRLSLDELPQLRSILLGEISFVGPRPALYNQSDLREMRQAVGIESVVPGLTGWAQINGRDDITNERKVELDLEYLHRRSLWFDLKILVWTFGKVLRSDGVKH